MVKKIGILFGRENTFPPALIDRINSKGEKDIVAEPVHIDKVVQGAATDYAVIMDRISQDVPFYRAYLKNAALAGTAVLNNPFWWSADEKFFNNCLMEVVGVDMPKTVILPSHERPTDTSADSFRNLALPLDYEAIFDYIGFPAYFKPHDGGGWKSVYKVRNPEELFKAWSETNQLVMMLQEEIEFESYFRCYCLDRKDVLIMPYEPRNPFHERYLRNTQVEPELHKKLKELVLFINKMLGYDFNTVEIAIKDGILYPIDFCNPAPDADNFSVVEENFERKVEHAAQMCISKAKKFKPGKQNLTWGDFIKKSTGGRTLV